MSDKPAPKLRLPKIPGYHPNKGVITGDIAEMFMSGIKTKKTWQEFTKEDCKFTAPMAAHHVAVWDWFEKLEARKAAEPIVLILGRGGGKTSTMCAGIAFIGERGSRSFALYVSSTQKQANQHLQEIADYMSSMGLERSVNEYGHSKGWNATTLRVSNDFNVVALGLDAAARGIKLDQLRPDLIVLDDIDELDDSVDVVQSKIETITSSILPSMASHGTVCFVQNVIHSNGIMSSFVRRENEFLLGAKVFGPYPAAYNLQVERYEIDGQPRYRVLGGEYTWEGQNLAIIEHQINTYGLKAFLRESQHEVFGNVDGALWTNDIIYGNPNAEPPVPSCRCTVREVPRLLRIAIAVDVAGSSNPKTSDATGIIVAGFGEDRRLYVLNDYSGYYTPHEVATTVQKLWSIYQADVIVVETNYGGDWVTSFLSSVDSHLPVVSEKVSQGKKTRAERTATFYGDYRVKHVTYQQGGTVVNPMEKLEWEMLNTNYDAIKKSPNRIDALVLAEKHLMGAVDAAPRVMDRLPSYLRR
jgi:hypothetical protein